MPLRDHFHPPWSEQYQWEGFHSAWVNTIVRHLNGALLPRAYRADPQVHLGSFVEADIAASGRDQPSDTAADGGTTAVWSPPAAVQTLDIEFPAQDVFEVQVYDPRRGTRLVAVMELVSPGNKDRPDQRRAFIAKCAAYLQAQVSVVVVDVVTARRANLHQGLLELCSPEPPPAVELPDLCAISYRNRKDNGRWRLDLWPSALGVGRPLPAVPLWLTPDLAVRVDLEATYEETGRVLRIDG